MSIRMIALELYRYEKELSSLKKELAEALPDRMEEIQHKINQAMVERNKLKGMLEAKKKP
ncbi:hypothetical protein [Desulfonatronovibrio hydrogenovorans]|uniref:hypothetical protein n=1 Tax=Desulfonatronovibrio hydrogenovorans TaxID=53245 RepID=UPI00048F490D|nr:hypothetical protein [Desulfonatronovibrio hydrogenovorans]